MLEGIVRDSIGKRASKSLKRDGYLIANIYAKGFDNINAAFKVNEFIKATRAKKTLPFEVSVGGKVYKVVIQEYQKHPRHKHPNSRRFTRSSRRCGKQIFSAG